MYASLCSFLKVEITNSNIYKEKVWIEADNNIIFIYKWPNGCR